MPLLTSGEALFKDEATAAADVADHEQQIGRRSEPARCQFRSVWMTKNPRKIEIVQQGDERFILKVEGRHDRSDAEVFTKHGIDEAGLPLHVKSQTLVVLGAVFAF